MRGQQMYGKEHRRLQNKFGTENLADRLEEMIVKTSLDERDKGFITSRDMFFLSTVDYEGRPTVSFKGGAIGFISVLDERTLAFPSYDGNGMFYSMGNISSTGRVGLLLIDFETPHRMRIQGNASIDLNDNLIEKYPSANLVVRISIESTWINCPRYIPTYKKLSPSKYVPNNDGEAPVPAWKKLAEIRDVLTDHDKEVVDSLGETLTMEQYSKKVSEGDG